MTKEAKAFIESLDVRYWKGKRIVTFDTIGPLSKDPQKRNRFIESASDWSRSAAWKLKELCENRGLSVTKTMHFAVVGMWEPLAPDGSDIARKQTHDFLKGLQ